LAVKKISSAYNVGSSWIESMETAMVNFDGIELGIAFPYKVAGMEKIMLEGHPVEYFMVPKYPIGQLGRFVRRISSSMEPRKALKDYMEVVEMFKPDIVHFFGTESDYTSIIPQLQVPSVIWFQGNLTVYQKMWQVGIPLWKAFLHERVFDVLNGKTFVHKYYEYAKRVKREQQVFRQGSNFIGRTDWDRRLVSVMAPQAKYFHCEEAMRNSFFEHQWEPHKNRKKLVLVSTIRESLYKGLETVFETSKILGEVLDRPLEWRIVGVKPNATYVRIVKSKVRVSSSERAVKVLGFKSGPELAQELLSADAYIHPSHIDNSPNSVCEAMLMGVPVISTNVGGIPSLLQDKEEGLLVQNGDPYAMAGAILELANHPEKAVQMGAAARERGLIRNDTFKICSDLLNIYNRIIYEKDHPVAAKAEKHT